MIAPRQEDGFVFKCIHVSSNVGMSERLEWALNRHAADGWEPIEFIGGQSVHGSDYGDLTVVLRRPGTRAEAAKTAESVKGSSMYTGG